MSERRVEVRPRWPFELPRRGGMDGVQRHDGGVLLRLLHIDGVAVIVRVAQPAHDRVIFGARLAGEPLGGRRQPVGRGKSAGEPPGGRARAAALELAIARMRFALGVDDDLRPFYERFRDDPLIGASVRARPQLRVSRRPDPFEALAWAIVEQLIEYPRAAAIQRRIVRRLGRRCPHSGLRDLPDPLTLARTDPALLESLDLARGRAVALVRAACAVVAGTVALDGPDHERGWRRLRGIPGIGSWTIEMLALHGQGRLDQVPAGDLGYLKLVGRLRGGNPRARAGEADVRALLAPYAPWVGLAGAHLLASHPPWAAGMDATLPANHAPWAAARTASIRSPVPAGTRWSSARPRRAA